MTILFNQGEMSAVLLYGLDAWYCVPNESFRYALLGIHC